MTSFAPRLSIRSRLALLVVALALPFAAFSVFVSVTESRAEETHAVDRLLGVSQVTAARLDDQLNDVRSVLQVLATLVSVDPAKTASNDALLHSMAASLPAHIDNLSVWTAEGVNVGTLDPRWRASGNVAAGRKFFREALSGATMSAEAPLNSLTTGVRISEFGVPIRVDGRIIGVMAASVRLDALQKILLSGRSAPDGAVMTVLDPRGVILARSLDPDRWVGKTFDGAAITGASATRQMGPDGPRTGPGADGVVRIAGFTSAQAAPWRVYVGVPRETALAPVRARLQTSLLTAGFVLLVGLVLAMLCAEKIVSPLRRLSDDAALFGAGNLAHRSHVESSSEVGLLARTMNDMAQQLQQRTTSLLATQEQFRQVTDNLPALISYLDADQRFQFANRVYATWLGQAPSELLGKSLIDLYGPSTYDGFKAHIERALSGERVSYERELKTLQGNRLVEVTAIPDTADMGRIRGLFIMMIDITAKRDAETALRQSARRLRLIADNIPATVAYVDREERYRFVNAYMGQVFRTDPAHLLGKTLREAGGDELYREMKPYVAAALGGEEVTYQGSWTIKSQLFHYQATYVPDVDAGGAVLGYYVMTFDITALKETQRRLDALARIDTLTELPNRRQFDERLLNAMAHARRTETTMAVMFLDIDHFKAINDTHGHGVGDLVLKEFGARLRHQLRSSDIVARLAGDEFVILAEAIQDLRQLKTLAGKIVESIRPPLSLDGRSITITTSIGIATYEGDDGTPADLMAAADRALYLAKKQGRDRFSIAPQGVAEALELAVARERISVGDPAG